MRQLILCILLAGLFLWTGTPQATAQDQSPDGPVYVVQSGDTLFLIAIRFGVTVNDLIKTNALDNPDLLSTGTELVIPGLEGIQGRLVTETIPLGESLRTLSIRHQIPIPQVIKLNRLTGPMEVFAGASLVVPDQGEANKFESRYPVESQLSLMQVSAGSLQNPWLLAEINHMEGVWDLLPGETLFAPGQTQSGSQVVENGSSLVSPLIGSLEISPLPLVQGFTAVVKVSASQPIELSGSLAGNQLHFFPNGENQWVALQGIHAMANPGINPFMISGHLDDGRSFEFEQMVVLQAAGYSREDIKGVDPTTLDPAVTLPENEKVFALVSPATATKHWDQPFTSPGYDPNWITSWFGTRRSYNESSYSFFHTGVDYGGGTGLDIKAPAPGIVVFAGPLTVRGNATIIDHGWGVYSGFWHQSEFKVVVGDRVESGQVIGLVGGSGRVTGAHLHWEIWVNRVQVNPLTWLNQVYP
jgi:murein DD-endopeptidase MepM/ murein hydrolase activator NlpD